MRIVIVGAGAVGGYFGARLVQAGVDAAFLLRPKTHMVIREKGLRVKGADGESTVHPETASVAAELGTADAVILSVKNVDLEEALGTIEPLIGRDTFIVTLQNGVEAEQGVAERYGPKRVIGGVAYITSRLASPGLIEHFKRGILCFGELDGSETPRLQAFCEAFRKAGIRVQSTRDIRKTKWEKLCWNATFNPLSVIFDDTVRRILESVEALDIVRAAIREIREVTTAMEIRLADEIEEETIRVTRSLADYHTSMYEDYKAGRKTENDFFNGAVCRFGRKIGIETPVNRTLHALVKTLTETHPGRSAG